MQLILLLLITGLNDPDVQGTIGGYVTVDHFQGDSSDYSGFEIGGQFSPFRWTEAGFGCHMLFGNGQTHGYITGWTGVFTPELWRLNASAGLSVRLRAITPDIYLVDCICPGRDSSTGSSWSPYFGLGLSILGDAPENTLGIQSRAYMTQGEFSRISAGGVYRVSI